MLGEATCTIAPSERSYSALLSSVALGPQGAMDAVMSPLSFGAEGPLPGLARTASRNLSVVTVPEVCIYVCRSADAQTVYSVTRGTHTHVQASTCKCAPV